MYGLVRRAIGIGVVAMALLAGVVLPATSPRTHAQPRPLVLGGGHASAGVHSLRAGFTPDPFSISVRPVGSLRAQDMRLGPGCRGFVAAQPDVIVRFSGAASFLRFFARSSEDVTMIVNDPTGRFLCNDDVSPGRDTDPMVDVYQPRGGQYDVWIGTHAPEARPSVTFFVTEVRTQQP